jgi:Cys-tRNA(Pro) deacylase
MSKQKHVSETPATQFLKQHKVAFEEHPYEYVDHGGALEAARQLGLDPHSVAKTLIMEDEHARPLVILMHGDREVSTKNLARQIGVKKVTPCHPDIAQKHSGYLVGGTSPFATRRKMPVWVQASLLDFPQIHLNGGRRGYLISIAPSVLVGLLGAVAVDVDLDKD